VSIQAQALLPARHDEIRESAIRLRIRPAALFSAVGHLSHKVQACGCPQSALYGLLGISTVCSTHDSLQCNARHTWQLHTINI